VFVAENFVACRIEGSVGIGNSSIGGKHVFVCDGPREVWPRFWQHIKRYG
jgi:hypothetical protein